MLWGVLLLGLRFVDCLRFRFWFWVWGYGFLGFAGLGLLSDMMFILF